MKTADTNSPRFEHLKRSDLNVDPFVQFQNWFHFANEHIEIYPNHMILATVDKNQFPHSRVVLLKGFKPPYFQFFTNYKSQKGEDIANNNRASLLFYWKELGKQIRILGKIEKSSQEDNDAYWATRPRESQIHAWASEKQSRVVTDYQSLHSKVQETEERFKDQAIPRPEFWGGYQLAAEHFEFWQEGAFRLHHRFSYSQGPDKTWLIQRLNP